MRAHTHTHTQTHNDIDASVKIYLNGAGVNTKQKAQVIAKSLSYYSTA